MGTYSASTLAATIVDYYNMRANSSEVEDKVICLLSLRALPDGYKIFCPMLEQERENLTIGRLRTELRARYDLFKGGEIVEIVWHCVICLWYEVRN